MPSMTGEALARELHELRPDLPIIIATGYHERMSQQYASTIGVKAVLFKPFEIGSVARTIRQALTE
jgi:DNA-binding NtrC family response regulator